MRSMFTGLFYRLLPVPHSALQYDFGMDNTIFFSGYPMYW